MLPLIAAVILLALRLPLVAVIGSAAWLGLILGGASHDSLVQGLWAGLFNFSLTAILGFVLAGHLMTATGLTDDLVKIAQKLVARFTGGLGLVTITASLLFSSLSGSGGATCAAVGATMIPSMIKNGYPRPIAGALAAAGGVLGILIPPSIPMIIYAVVAKVPVNDLFLAGIIPGLILTALLGGMSVIQAKRAGLGPHVVETENFFKIIWRGKWSLSLVFILMGGIWGGFFTPTEAAIIAVLWVILAGAVKKTLKLTHLISALRQTALLAGAAVILLAPATALARYLAYIGAPQALAGLIANFAGSPTVFLLILFGFLLICGLVTDTISMIAILAPIFITTAHKLKVDPVLMGLVFVIGCEAGFLTPPFGGNLFIAAPLAQVEIGALSKAVFPYVLVITVLAVLIIFFPQIALWLPYSLK